ncbi:MAG TPA: hypothetical protein VFQ61_00800 [Polyangiaceae bacterium]|nr:hypothetical protein [Polyangiaceae bacterium]
MKKRVWSEALRRVRASALVWCTLVPLTWPQVGCASAGASAQPDQTLQAYARAVQGGRAREAYSLLSKQAQKNIPFESFERILKENPEELSEFAKSLQRPASPPLVTATVTPSNGPPLLLVYENGAWRVDASSVDLYSQATPERAVAAFVRAYENQRYDVLLRFVPDAQKHELTPASLKQAWTVDQKEDVARMMQALKAALPSARFELLGDRATLAYGAGGSLELLREHGAWKVEDLK